MRWGIAGPGAIAVGFANGLAQLDDADLVAVGSRSPERAAVFAERFRIPWAHGSYEALAADPNVDVVYVATPQSRHESDVTMFLEAGKAVLCEKPFALSQAQGQRMIDAAARYGGFVMEAMWSRFLPAYRTLRGLLDDEAIGEVRLVEADFGYRLPFDAEHRLYDPRRGGGGLLDLGVYPVQLTSLVLGTPAAVCANGHLGPTGVDEQVAAVFGFDGGAIGIVKAAIGADMTCTARICGTKGTIELPAFMHCPTSLTVTSGAGREVIDASWEGEGLRFQVEEVQRCVAAGEQESLTMPHAETLSILGTLDAIREAIGLVFPGEQPT